MRDAPILICYDGSDESRHAITAAAELLGSREAVVLAVAPALTVAERLALTNAFVPRTAFENPHRADALLRAREGALLAVRAGFRATARGETAPDAWGEIVDVADELDASAIVIGSRGLLGVERIPGDSVSEGVTRHAGRPVLVVPPPVAAS